MQAELQAFECGCADALHMHQSFIVCSIASLHGLGRLALWLPDLCLASQYTRIVGITVSCFLGISQAKPCCTGKLAAGV